MAAAVSLGMTRFAYALLLPSMREDLSWTYTLAGAMNTLNACGYLVGALLTPWALRRLGAVGVLIWGALAATLFMALTGFITDTSLLLLQRFLAGLASATVFVCRGVAPSLVVGVVVTGDALFDVVVDACGHSQNAETLDA